MGDGTGGGGVGVGGGELDQSVRHNGERNANLQVLTPINDIVKVNAGKAGEMQYIWKEGRTIYLSKKVMVVAEEFIRTRNYAQCARRLKEEMGIEVGWKTCMRWLRHGLHADWMKQRMEELGVYNGWTKERWYKVMTDHVTDVKRMKGGDLYAMKLIAEYKNWGNLSIMNNNVSINFTERGK